ncbi:MAG: glycerate kinase, partial [Bacteroidales bacterium]|nr:glycerate kinase [Bacteroidales bacterium]
GMLAALGFKLQDGEGTVDAFLSALGGKKHQCAVAGPLGEPVLAEYGITDDGTAIIEIASAAGLPLVPENKRDPLNTTTYGVGELISDAIGRGVRNFIVGLGGSATNDGGAGMLAALGFKLQ